MLQQIRGAISGDPWAVVNSLAAKDPQIAEIVTKYKQMQPSDAVSSLGINYEQFRSLIGS